MKSGDPRQSSQRNGCARDSGRRRDGDELVDVRLESDLDWRPRARVHECPIALGSARLSFADCSIQPIDLGVQRGYVGRTTLGVHVRSLPVLNGSASQMP